MEIGTLVSGEFEREAIPHAEVLSVVGVLREIYRDHDEEYAVIYDADTHQEIECRLDKCRRATVSDVPGIWWVQD